LSPVRVRISDPPLDSMSMPPVPDWTVTVPAPEVPPEMLTPPSGWDASRKTALGDASPPSRYTDASCEWRLMSPAGAIPLVRIVAP